jgi:imidazolonepropionase-like amidohydrolase
VPVAAHAHGTPAVEQAIAIGVDGVEHCRFVTDRGVAQVRYETLEALPRSQITVCPQHRRGPSSDEGTAAGQQGDDRPAGVTA